MDLFARKAKGSHWLRKLNWHAASRGGKRELVPSRYDKLGVLKRFCCDDNSRESGFLPMFMRQQLLSAWNLLCLSDWLRMRGRYSLPSLWVNRNSWVPYEYQRHHRLGRADQWVHGWVHNHSCCRHWKRSHVHSWLRKTTRFLSYGIRSPPYYQSFYFGVCCLQNE